MTRRMIGPCLAVLLMSVLVVESASAVAPEYGRCIKTAIGAGTYGNAGCTTVGGEKDYRWLPGLEKAGFTTKIKAATVFKFETSANGGSVPHPGIRCEGETSAGTIVGEKTARITSMTLTGCTFSLGGPCKSEGAEGGEIRLKVPLIAMLGVIKKGTEAAKNQVGLDLKPESGELLAEFNCGVPGEKELLKGSVIVPVPANKMLAKATLKYAATVAIQKPTHLEGESTDVLFFSFTGEEYEQAGLKLTTIQTNEEKVEVNSTV
jgi:hypothetical protein